MEVFTLEVSNIKVCTQGALAACGPGLCHSYQQCVILSRKDGSSICMRNFQHRMYILLMAAKKCWQQVWLRLPLRGTLPVL